MGYPMSDEDYTMQITEEGALLAYKMHQQITEQGWTLEQVAAYNGYDTIEVRIMLYLLYHALEQSDISLDELSEEDLALLTGE